MGKKFRRHKSSESDYRLGSHNNINKKNSHSLRPRSRDRLTPRSRHKHNPFGKNPSELSESSSSRSESPFKSKSSYEMCCKQSRDLSQDALSQLDKYCEELALQRI